MTVIFCARMFADIDNNVKISKHPNSVSSHKHQAGLLDGLLACGADVSVINVQRVRGFPDYPEKFLKETPFLWNGRSLGINLKRVNCFPLKNLSQSLSLLSALEREVKKHGDEKVVLFLFNPGFVQSGILGHISRKFPNVTISCMVGDLHGRYGLKQRGVKTLPAQLLGLLADRFCSVYDNYVFVTKDMASALRIGNKPYVVVESLYVDTVREAPEAPEEEKRIFYAGSLSLDYGILHMLRAFSLIKDPDYRLVVAGNGDGRETLEEYAKGDRRIQYLGFITPREVHLQQQRAAVLISPRTSERNFVKYSFASKTLDSLASGKPYVAHRLPCDPPEYADYIQYADDESDEALCAKIVEICSLPREERAKIGANGRAFVLREKNPKVMCQRVMDMWSES